MKKPTCASFRLVRTHNFTACILKWIEKAFEIPNITLITQYSYLQPTLNSTPMAKNRCILTFRRTSTCEEW